MLKDLMRQKGISAKELSEKSGIPYSTISALSNGTRDIYKCEIGSCQKMAAVLSVTIGEFYDWCFETKEIGEDKDYSLKLSDNNCPDIYDMSREDNIALAKRNIIDSIYRSAKLEGLAVTFAQTEEIYNKGIVNNVDINDITAVNNLKHAWKFILETMNYPMDILYLRQINKEVGEGIIHNAGDIRNDAVSMGGTKWIPEIPNYDTVKDRIESIMRSDRTVTDKALSMFLYVCRQQPFFDGNKRTATIAADQMLIREGKGLLSIPENLDTHFKLLLIKYYETNDMKDVKDFLYKNCLNGYGAIKTLSQPDINKEMFYEEGKTEDINGQNLEDDQKEQEDEGYSY